MLQHLQKVGFKDHLRKTWLFYQIHLFRFSVSMVELSKISNTPQVEMIVMNKKKTFEQTYQLIRFLAHILWQLKLFARTFSNGVVFV